MRLESFRLDHVVGLLSSVESQKGARLPFPNSVGGIFPGPASTQKVYQGIEWFSHLVGRQWLTVLKALFNNVFTLKNLSCMVLNGISVFGKV